MRSTKGLPLLKADQPRTLIVGDLIAALYAEYQALLVQPELVSLATSSSANLILAGASDRQHRFVAADLDICSEEGPPFDAPLLAA